ncbi:molybdate ABC transporter substrate-binding protein [Luteococcus sp. Sow4_B9]|uniref:molybdate ABC transporter substrate-binding protein n=1 Tax=Luteococcus sp. Sow4_B9 TaxID=3438792 RepID=UPI003F963403
MSNRRAALAALAVLPLVACSSTGAGDATTPSPSSPAASGAAPTKGDVLVYAPGALAALTKPIAAAYEQAGLGTVTFEVGHTPIQREQLAKGATPDVWIAANPDDMATTADKGLVDGTTVTQLGRTALTIVVAPKNPAGVTAVTDLTKPGTKVLLGAETLPIWKVTDKAFAKIEKQQPGFTAKVMANVASREMGVQPIVTKVSMGEADAGIVFATDVTKAAKDKGLTTVAIPEEQNAMLPISTAVVTAGKNPTAAQGFVDFLSSGEGHDVLTEAGFLPPAK